MICDHPLLQNSVLKAKGNIWDKLVSRVAIYDKMIDGRTDRGQQSMRPYVRTCMTDLTVLQC